MIDRTSLVVSLIGFLALAIPASADEAKISIEDLPKAVLKAAKSEFPGAKIRAASKEVEDGETKYEVELTVDGKNVDLLIEADGEIEAIEKEIEVEDLPKAVLKAAKAKFPKAKIEKVEEISSEDDKVVYELSMAFTGKKSVEVVIAPNGKIIEKDDDGDKDEKVKKTDEDDEKGKKGKKDKDEEEDDEKGKRKPKD
jgi:hypothetical protein